MRMTWKLRLSVFAFAVGVAGVPASPARARSLARQLSDFIQTRSNAIANEKLPDTITPVVERLAAEATDFPVPPTTPGYVFVYNAEQGIFERSTGSLGPVFLERAETVGRNHASIGMSYLYGNVNQFDGEDLAQGGLKTRIGARYTASTLGLDRPPVNLPPNAKVETGVALNGFDLPTNKFNFAATYGVTDDWDVGFLLPLVVTKLQVTGRSYAGAVPVNEKTAVFLPEQGTAGFDASSVGVGDLLLRTKYRFGYLADFDFAGGLILRFPTGSEPNFQGIGNWTVEPLLIVSRAVGLQDFHANLGMEFNAGDATRTRARYGIGATLQTEALDWVALLLDIVGTSGLDDEQVASRAVFNPQAPPESLVVPSFGGATRLKPNSDGSVTVISTLPRTDQVNIAMGFKFAIWGNALGYVNAVVPLTRQGLQANVLSAVGLEYSF